MFGFFYYDWTLLIVLPALIFTIIAQVKVRSSFERFSKISTRRHLTGAEVARRILDSNGLYDVRIERVRGSMTDHFDPKARVIRLSETVHDVSSVAAVGVAAHEAGHAVQHALGYAPMKVRAAIIPVTNIGANISWPLVLIGLLLGSYSLAMLGVIAFGFSTLFQLVTLPVEFNASHRAVAALESTFSSEEEIKGAKKVLFAAAMTYVAALAVSLANLLRLFFIVSGNNRRR